MVILTLYRQIPPVLAACLFFHFRDQSSVCPYTHREREGNQRWHGRGFCGFREKVRTVGVVCDPTRYPGEMYAKQRQCPCRLLPVSVPVVGPGSTLYIIFLL